MKNYKTVAKSRSYSVEIYENCSAVLQVRKDGKRARLIFDTTEWHGNSGSLVEKTMYFDNVRSVIKRFRNAQIECLKYGLCRNHYKAFFEIAGEGNLCSNI